MINIMGKNWSYGEKKLNKKQELSEDKVTPGFQSLTIQNLTALRK